MLIGALTYFDSRRPADEPRAFLTKSSLQVSARVFCPDRLRQDGRGCEKRASEKHRAGNHGMLKFLPGLIESVGVPMCPSPSGVEIFSLTA